MTIALTGIISKPSFTLATVESISVCMVAILSLYCRAQAFASASMSASTRDLSASDLPSSASSGMVNSCRTRICSTRWRFGFFSSFGLGCPAASASFALGSIWFFSIADLISSGLMVDASAAAIEPEMDDFGFLELGVFMGSYGTIPWSASSAGAGSASGDSSANSKRGANNPSLSIHGSGFTNDQPSEDSSVSSKSGQWLCFKHWQ